MAKYKRSHLRSRMHITMVGLLAAFSMMMGVVALGSPASATSEDQVCEGLDSGKIDTTGDPETVTVTAPEGKLIDGYCVKAGSANQGDGPVYVTVDPPVVTLTFGHPSGKAVSHYSLSYTTTPPPDQCPDGTNPGDVDGDGDADAVDCDYTPPPPDQCPDGTNPGDLNGDGTVNEADCGYVPPAECPDGEVWYDDNGNGVVDLPLECAPIHYDPPPPGDDDNPPPGDDSPAPNNPPFQADTGAVGSGSNPMIPVGLVVALLLGLTLLFASGRKAGAQR